MPRRKKLRSEAPPRTEESSHGGVRVGVSFAGKGVFATRAYREGEEIGGVRGTFHDDPDYGSNYAIDLGDDETLEPSAPFRYLNHCCVPNATLYVHEYRRAGQLKKRVTVDALADIRPGEELTIDYAWSASAAIPCLCGHPQCRGWVVDVAQLPLVLESRSASPPPPPT